MVLYKLPIKRNRHALHTWDDDQLDEMLERVADTYTFITKHTIREYLWHVWSMKVSKEFLAVFLHEKKFSYKKVRIVPFLTEDHKAKRIQWA